MKNELKITLVQSRLQWRDPAENRSHLERMIRESGPSDLYVMPETFTTGFLGETRETDEDMEGETVAWMRSLATDMGGAVCGSAVIGSEEGRRNRFLFQSPGGGSHYYDKRHLFGFAGEDQRYVAGDDRTIFQYEGWRVSPQICYDLRFPVWCRVRDDYDMLLFVANWPSRRVDAWDALLRARAIENQCYVVAVNRVGEDGNGIQYPGHSAIYDPFGASVIEPWGEEGTRSATIDLSHVQDTRKDFPFTVEADAFTIA